jgi:regulator of sigma E protease
MNIIVSLIGLSIIIIVHEFGHYCFAKLSGLKVKEFSIGMGSKIFGFNFKDTAFSLRIFPLGGYVKIPEIEENQYQNFSKISFLKKFFILIAGSCFNILFSLIIFFLIFFFFGYPQGVSNRIDKVNADTPAFYAGLQESDKIISINGEKVDSGENLIEKLALNENRKVINVLRENEQISFSLSPNIVDNRAMIGIVLERTKGSPYIFIGSIKRAIFKCSEIIIYVFKGFFLLFNREVGIEQISGPLGIISLTSQASSQGTFYLVWFLAIISINLAVINLLPFFPLDGGRVVTLFLSLFISCKIVKNIEYFLSVIGTILIIILIIYISYFDIHKILLK